MTWSYARMLVEFLLLLTRFALLVPTQAASLKDKWGLGYKPSYNRSKSISAAAGRPPLKRMDRQK